jgi:hypothetical protein
VSDGKVVDSHVRFRDDGSLELWSDVDEDCMAIFPSESVDILRAFLLEGAVECEVTTVSALGLPDHARASVPWDTPAGRYLLIPLERESDA